MKQYFLAPLLVMLALYGSWTAAAEARLDTRDIVAYQRSLNELNLELTRQEIADLNWQLTVLAYGDKPASMTDEAYATALMTFMMEHVDIWLQRAG